MYFGNTFSYYNKFISYFFNISYVYIIGCFYAFMYNLFPTISATVSMPLRWEKLQSIVPTDFTILNVPEVIRKTGDAWKDILDQKQDLLEILETME